jgi:phasin family protein
MAKQNASQTAKQNASQIGAFDVEAIVTSQRKNIEALTQANQYAVEGVQKVLHRQFEIAGQTLDNFSTMVRDLFKPNGSPESWMVKQAEFSKKTIEDGLANVRTLTETVTQANTAAFNIIGKRMTESLDEVRGYGKQRPAAD